MTDFKKKLLQYKGDNSGSILMTVAPFLAVMVILIGGFIDFGRGNINRSETLGAIDAAALAAAGLPDEYVQSLSDRVSIAERYYNFNVEEILGSRVAFSDLRINIQDTGIGVDVSVDAVNSIGTIFLQSMNVSTVSTSGSTRVLGTGTVATVLDADIVFIGDVSGSMKYCDYNNTSNRCPEFDRSRGYNVSDKARMMINEIYPLDDRGNRIEMPTVRVGMTSYKTTEYAYYGRTVSPSFAGDSLRASYDDAERFIDQYIGDPSHWSGWTCGSCGMSSAISLFDRAPVRMDGLKNSPVKVIIFLTDGQINRPVNTATGLSLMDQECQRAKNENIMIFAIAYGPTFINGGRDTTTGLRNCASDYTDEHGVHQKRFYIATDSVQLEEVMKNTIPTAIRQMRIVK